jgi:hypothetical protein
MADRKPLIVLGVLALVAILLFVFGVFGAGRGKTATGMPEWASPSRSRGDQLTGADLEVSSSCNLEGATISFTGTCVAQVRKINGGLPWERVTRRAILIAGPQPVILTLTIRVEKEKTLRTDLDPGDNVRLTYTREGGTLGLTCLAVGGCVVVLAEDT